jgi:hypothetical protein
MGHTGKVDDGAISDGVDGNGVGWEAFGATGRGAVMKGVASGTRPAAATFLAVCIVAMEDGVKDIDRLGLGGIEGFPFGLEPAGGVSPVANWVLENKIAGSEFHSFALAFQEGGGKEAAPGLEAFGSGLGLEGPEYRGVARTGAFPGVTR